jgi:hypothetical protein
VAPNTHNCTISVICRRVKYPLVTSAESVKDYCSKITIKS